MSVSYQPSGHFKECSDNAQAGRQAGGSIHWLTPISISRPPSYMPKYGDGRECVSCAVMWGSVFLAECGTSLPHEGPLCWKCSSNTALETNTHTHTARFGFLEHVLKKNKTSSEKQLFDSLHTKADQF